MNLAHREKNSFKMRNNDKKRKMAFAKNKALYFKNTLEIY